MGARHPLLVVDCRIVVEGGVSTSLGGNRLHRPAATCSKRVVDRNKKVRETLTRSRAGRINRTVGHLAERNARMKGGAGQKYLDLEDAQILEVDTKILFLLSDRLFA